MALLTAAQILDAPDRKHKVVAVPEWGGDVLVWEATASQRDRLETMCLNKREHEDQAVSLRAVLLAFSICDEQGQPLFTEADIVALSKKNYKVLDRIREVADRLSGLTDEDKKDLAKNSQAQSDGETGESQ